MITCERCNYQGELATFDENLSSVHSAIRCLSCHSTKNAFNRAHQVLMREALDGGPTVTNEAVLKKMNEL